jgi:hypothetical protein
MMRSALLPSLHVDAWSDASHHMVLSKARGAWPKCQKPSVCITWVRWGVGLMQAFSHGKSFVDWCHVAACEGESLSQKAGGRHHRVGYSGDSG